MRKRVVAAAVYQTMTFTGSHSGGCARADCVGTAVLGAGPAGLSAAYGLALRGRAGVVYEADGCVGGMARTICRESYRFDLGGQLFATELEPIADLWRRLLGDDLVLQPHRSRILYEGQYLEYALRARDFVARLGRSGAEIEWQWAIRRLDELSLQDTGGYVAGLRRPRTTTLVEELHYPRFGPGQMWEALGRLVTEYGIPMRLSHRCVAIAHEAGHVTGVRVRCDGNHLDSRVDAVLSSIPVDELVRLLDPPPPLPVIEAAGRLRYRGMCVVALITEEEPFPESWIHVCDGRVRASRVQNFRALSRHMAPRGTTCLGVEYFCDPGDEVWTLSEAEAIDLAKRELGHLGLIDPTRVVGGNRIRVPRACPISDPAGDDALSVIRDHLQALDNLETFGRNGLHRDLTQDQSMWTALVAATNVIAGTSYDVWSLGGDLQPHPRERCPPAMPPVAPSVAPVAEAVGDRSG